VKNYTKCGHCNGTGKIELTGVYADTLKLLKAETARRAGSSVNGAMLGRVAGCGGTAMCNRLMALQKLGFAKSVAYGRERLWEAV